MDTKCSTEKMDWYYNTLLMREPCDMTNKEFLHIVDTYCLDEAEQDIFGPDLLKDM